MQISFTEKKNIRKSFGKLKESLSIPNLIEVQKNSYDELTQALNDYLNGGTEENGSETKSKDTTKKVTVKPSTYDAQKTSDAFDDLFNN